MKQDRIGWLSVIAGVLLTLSPLIQAGSERLIMVMTPGRMASLGLIHIRFQDSQGRPLPVDALKRMAVRDNDCTTGQVFEMPFDYKYGYSPAKQLGLYLPPQLWKDRTLCFALPELVKGPVGLAAKDVGHSITLRLEPVDRSH